MKKLPNVFMRKNTVFALNLLGNKELNFKGNVSWRGRSFSCMKVEEERKRGTRVQLMVSVQEYKRNLSYRDMKRKYKKVLKEEKTDLEELKKKEKNVSSTTLNAMKANMPEVASGKGDNSSKAQLYFDSMQRIMDEYVPPLTHPSIFSREGWNSRKKVWKNWMTNLYFWWQAKNKNPGSKMDKKEFLLQAETVYTYFNQALASRDLQALADVSTLEALTKVKNQIVKKKPLPPGVQQEWVGKVR